MGRPDDVGGGAKPESCVFPIPSGIVCLDPASEPASAALVANWLSPSVCDAAAEEEDAAAAAAAAEVDEQCPNALPCRPLEALRVCRDEGRAAHALLRGL